MEDRASLDNMAKACIFPNNPPSPSVRDLSGRPIKVYFNFLNIFFSFAENFNKCYYTALKKGSQGGTIGSRIFLQAEGCYFWYNRGKKMRLEEMIFDTHI